MTLKGMFIPWRHLSSGHGTTSAPWPRLRHLGNISRQKVPSGFWIAFDHQVSLVGPSIGGKCGSGSPSCNLRRGGHEVVRITSWMPSEKAASCQAKSGGHSDSGT